MAVIGAMTFPTMLVNHAELRGRSIITNGLEEMRKYNPATGNWLPAVLRPIRQAPVLAAGGAGNLNGEYEYRLVPYNINEDEEGQPWPGDEEDAAYQINVANQSVNLNLAGLRIDSPETTHVRIYRTVAGGIWPAMALVGEVLLPAGVFNDNVDDDDLDFANEGLPYLVQVPVPKPYICQHRGRIFGIGDIPYSVGTAQVVNGTAIVTPAGGAVWGFWLETKEFTCEGDTRTYIIEEYDPVNNTLILAQDYEGPTGNYEYRICGDPDALIWCEEGFETQWPAINTRPVGGKEADKPTGIMSDITRLIVSKSRRLYSVAYTTIPNIPYSRVTLISDEYGCLAHRTMRHIKGIPTFADKHGIVQVVSQGAQLLQEAPDVIRWVDDELNLDGDGTLQVCFAVEWKAKSQYLWFLKSTEAAAACDKVLVWHYDRGRFSYYRFLTEFSCGENVKRDDGEDVVVLGDIYGHVWEFPYGYIDGAPAGVTLTGIVDAYYHSGSPDICTIIDEDAQWPTTGLGLAGVPIYIYAGTGAGQVGIIAANGENYLILEECLEVDLDSTSRYHLGPIWFRYRTGWLDFGNVRRVKYAGELHLVYERHPETTLTLNMRRDFDETPLALTDGVTGQNAGQIAMNAQNHRQMVNLGGIQGTHHCWEVENLFPNQPVDIYDVALALRMLDP